VTRRPCPTWPALPALVCAAGVVAAACSGTAAVTQSSPWWSSVRKPGAVQTDAFRHLPGSSTYRCVRVGHHSNVRSGSFLAGNFAADEQMFAAVYRQNGRHTEVKIYWVPLDVGHMSKLTVHATLLPSRSVSRTVEQSQVAANRYVFYPSGIPIPVPGTWEFTANAGSNRGCFIAAFLAPAS
jgi:hypothetical protein